MRYYCCYLEIVLAHAPNSDCLAGPHALRPHRQLLQVFGPPSTATVTDRGPSQASSSVTNSPTKFKTQNDGTAAA